MKLPKGSNKHFQDRTGFDGTNYEAGTKRINETLKNPVGNRRQRKDGIGDGTALEARFRDKKSEGLGDTWRKMNTSIRKDGK